jgi:hypothetical protein
MQMTSKYQQIHMFIYLCYKDYKDRHLPDIHKSVGEGKKKQQLKWTKKIKM